eukprot:scaffold80077_cov27-Tisochrysis_lutea.AAC.1
MQCALLRVGACFRSLSFLSHSRSPPCSPPSSPALLLLAAFHPLLFSVNLLLPVKTDKATPPPPSRPPAQACVPAASMDEHDAAGSSTGLVTIFDADWGPWVLTLGAGIASALFFSLRQRFRAPRVGVPDLPGALATAGAIRLRKGDVGDDAEVLRDFSRAVAAGGVHVMHLPEEPRVVRPHSEVQSPANAGNQKGLEACRQAFTEALANGRTGPISDASVQRILRMLSVGPAVSLLLQVGCPPSLQSHRFIVVCGGRTVRVLTIGFLPNPQTGKPQHVLTIASPDLLPAPSTDASESPANCREEGTELSYQVRPSTSVIGDIDSEILLEIPQWIGSYTDTDE